MSIRDGRGISMSYYSKEVGRLSDLLQRDGRRRLFGRLTGNCMLAVRCRRGLRQPSSFGLYVPDQAHLRTCKSRRRVVVGADHAGVAAGSVLRPSTRPYMLLVLACFWLSRRCVAVGSGLALAGMAVGLGIRQVHDDLVPVSAGVLLTTLLAVDAART